MVSMLIKTTVGALHILIMHAVYKFLIVLNSVNSIGWGRTIDKVELCVCMIELDNSVFDSLLGDSTLLN